MNFDILRQKILEKAIRGELVPQLESEPEVKQIGEAPEDVPFAIPEKWKWVNLHSTLKAISDGSHNPPPNVGHGVPVLSAKNVINGIIDTNSVTRWTTEEQWSIEDKKIHIQSGDVLLTIVGTIGRTAVVPNDCEKFMLQRSVCVMKPKECVNPEFLALILNSPSLFEWIMDHASGTAQKGIYLKTVKQIPIPLPSIEEQRRIVTKINQLFEQIDFAEKAYDELSGPLAERFRQLCLEKAIQGKLVPQLESEPEVEQIGEAPEDVPFAIPEKWKWVLFSDAVKVISSRPFQIKAKEVLEQGLYPVISQSKEQIDGYSNDDKKLIPDSELPIIIFGDHTRTLKYVDFRFVVGADGTKLLHVKTSSIDPKYFYIALQSMIGQTRQRGYSRHFQFLKVLHIPIPPIEEQRRIVAKLNELLDSTSQLERTISTP